MIILNTFVMYTSPYVSVVPWAVSRLLGDRIQIRLNAVTRATTATPFGKSGRYDRRLVNKLCVKNQLWQSVSRILPERLLQIIVGTRTRALIKDPRSYRGQPENRSRPRKTSPAQGK